MELSIITINFNNKEGLVRTLDSITKQTLHNFETIIIDGGSSDGSLEVIESFKKNNYNVTYVSEKDKGIYNAMNKGIDFAVGKYCIFMNSGDCFYNEKSIANSVEYLTGKWDIVSGIATSDKYVMFPPTSEQLSLSFFLKNSLNHQATYISTRLLKDLHYNENLKIVSDTEFFFRTLVLMNCSYVDIPIKISFCEVAGISGNLDRSLNERYQAIKNLLPSRMKYDVDFIIKHHNPIIKKINKILYNNFFRSLYRKILQLK